MCVFNSLCYIFQFSDTHVFPLPLSLSESDDAFEDTGSSSPEEDELGEQWNPDCEYMHREETHTNLTYQQSLLTSSHPLPEYWSNKAFLHVLLWSYIES